MKRFLKNFLIITVILIAAVLLAQSFGTSKITVKTKTVGLNELVNLITQGQMSKITVKDNDIIGIDKTGQKIISKMDQKGSFFDVLKYYNIDAVKLNTVKIDFATSSDWSSWILFGILGILPIVFIFGFFGFLNKQTKSGPGQMFSFGQSNLKQFNPNKKKTTFKDVAGMKEEKDELKEIVEFLKSPKKFTDLGATIPKGVLLMGAAGVGKTLMARAVAGESNVPFFHVSGSEFVEMFVGVGASRVRSAFAIAKKAAPSILFIDEIDAIGRERGTGLGGGQDEREQTLNQILVEMDGFDNNTNVIVMAATNRPDVLDSALLRPGRFDRRIVLHLPDMSEREEILKIHMENKKMANNINTRKIAERTPGFSGADLENLVNEGALLAAKNNKSEIVENDILISIEKVLLGPERKSHIINENEKKIIAFHEGGHALTATQLKHADPIHKISIISRGRAAGYTLQLPNEDNNFKTRSEILDELVVLMGGYAAEEIAFNEISTGASNDLKIAAERAKAFVIKYGMSRLGPVSWVDEESVFIGKQMTTRQIHSEEMSAKIDNEISYLINIAYKKAKEILSDKKELLEKISKELLTKETLEKEEFYALLEEK